MDEFVLEAMQSRYIGPHDPVESASARDENIRSVIEKVTALGVKHFKSPTVVERSDTVYFWVRKEKYMH